MPRRKNPLFGNYDSLWEVRSNREELRARKGGGIVTSLLLYSLDKKIINKALVVIPSDKEPWAQPIIATTPEQILDSAGSKYVFVPYGNLVKKLDENSALVGLPCQIMVNAKKDCLKIGLFDGMPIRLSGIKYLLNQLGIDPENIKKLDYRAPGGGLCVEMKNGEVVRYKSYFWLSYFFACKHCSRCTDSTSHFADIAVGDRRPGWSTVIVRTERGKKLFQNALRDGYIEATEIHLGDFLSKISTPFYWKEIRGGYIKSMFVRSRGKWVTKVPLPILKRIGRFLYRYTGKVGREALKRIARQNSSQE